MGRNAVICTVSRIWRNSFVGQIDPPPLAFTASAYANSPILWSIWNIYPPKCLVACVYDLNARIEAVSELVLDWELQKGANSPNPAPEEQILCCILIRLGIYIDLRWASARGFCPKISKHGLWGTHEQMHTLLLRYVVLCRMSGTEWMIIYHSRY